MEIKDYLPKRVRDRVVRVDVDADFDYNKNRSVQHYFITLDDGTEFDATTIKELKETAKKIINDLPVDMNKEKVIQQMEALKDVTQDDSVAEQVSTRIWNKAIQACIQIVKDGGINK